MKTKSSRTDPFFHSGEEVSAGDVIEDLRLTGVRLDDRPAHSVDNHLDSAGIGLPFPARHGIISLKS